MSKKRKRKDEIGEVKQEIDILDHMLDALVETLEEKGIITTEEWEKKIKVKIEHTAKTQQSFRELES
jgi:DNA-binding HxlR family transcriptional regulator